MPELSDGALLRAIRSAAAGTVSAAASEAASDGISCLEIGSAHWRTALRAAQVAGARLDWLGGTDVGGAVELTAHVFTRLESVLLLTRIDDGMVAPSAVEVFPAARWHQREVAEMFGVDFDDGPYERLLLADSIVGFPLRRDFALTPRLTKRWPGAAGQEPRRRRTRVPGVHPEWTAPPEVPQ